MKKPALVLLFIVLFFFTSEASFAQTSDKLPLIFVEGSPDYPGEEWSNAIDGDLQGWDGTVTTKGSPPYAIFDLGQLVGVNSVRLLTDTGVGYNSRWLKDFRIQVSTTGTSLGDFSTVLSASKTTGNWETFSFTPASARYIKLIIDNPPAPDGWHQLGEIEVYGSGASDADLDNDGDVDQADYLILVAEFGFTGCGNVADIDSNCKVDIFDYSILVTNFGTSATPTPTPPSFLTPTPRPTQPPQVGGHTFPRSAVYTWCCKPADYYALFDLVLTRDEDPGLISEIRRLNPNVKKLITEDVNCGDNWLPNKPDAWLVKDSQGNDVDLVGYCRGLVTPNLSDLSGYPGALVQEAVDRVAASGADGFMTDGLFYTGHYGWYGFGNDVDLDRNGLNDLTEPGKGKSWALSHWGAGVDAMIDTIRSGVGDNWIVINTGSQDCPNCSVVNGLYFEHQYAGSNFVYDLNLMANLSSTVSPPPIFVLNITIDPRDPESEPNTWDNFPGIRFGLAQAMLLGEYLQLEAWETGEHNWTEYIDEFDLDVGYPKGGAAEIAPGVWARIFDSGAVIGNFNDRDVTITDQQLRSAPGYAGPYWRFRGCQNPAVNNGEQFDSVVLHGHSYVGYQNAVAKVGDGIVLVDRSSVTACPAIPPRPPSVR